MTAVVPLHTGSAVQFPVGYPQEPLFGVDTGAGCMPAQVASPPTQLYDVTCVVPLQEVVGVHAPVSGQVKEQT